MKQLLNRWAELEPKSVRPLEAGWEVFGMLISLPLNPRFDSMVTGLLISHISSHPRIRTVNLTTEHKEDVTGWLFWIRTKGDKPVMEQGKTMLEAVLGAWVNTLEVLEEER